MPPTRKTTAALKISGNWRGDARKKTEPQFEGVPRKPAWLSKEAAIVWDRLQPELVEKGVVRFVDADVLAAYCESAATLERCAKELKKGEFIKNRFHEKAINPAVKVRNEAMGLMIRLANELGLSPASRSKVKADRESRKPSKGEFFGATG